MDWNEINRLALEDLKQMGSSADKSLGEYPSWALDEINKVMNTPGAGVAMGSALGGIPLDRLSTLMESPLYFTMSPAERLALVKGYAGSGSIPKEALQGAAWKQMQLRLADLLGGVNKEKLISLFGAHKAGGL